MSVSELCQKALYKAGVLDPDVERVLNAAGDELDEAYKIQSLNTDAAYMEGEIPKPASHTDPRTVVNANDGKKPPGKALRGWRNFLKLRTASMLRGPLTHAKNILATGSMVGIIRPMEEAIAITISRLTAAESRSYSELWAHYGGMRRGAIDAMQMIGNLRKEIATTGTINKDQLLTQLSQKGYPAELSRSKVDLIEEALRTGNMGKVDDQMRETGIRYLSGILSPEANKKAGSVVDYIWNVGSDSPYAALQIEDMVAKMASYRANVEQDLTRKAFAKNLYGESADAFVMKEWGKHTEENKIRFNDQMAGIPEDELPLMSDTARQASYQAAEDTFTQTMETDLGRFLVSPPPVFHELADLISPFRSIYVNLHRQTFSKRLLSFVHPATRAELTHADPLRRQAAQARLAGSWLMLGATAVVTTTAGIKIWGKDEYDAAQRDLVYRSTGKIGNTMQIGNTYIPLDALPPSVALPLQYYTGLRDNMQEASYRMLENPSEHKQKILMKAMGGFMQMIADQNWVADYIDFIGKVNGAVQSGQPQRLGVYLAELAAQPFDPMQDVERWFGAEDNVIRNYDGVLSAIRYKFTSTTEDAPARRNMNGDPVKRHSKFAVSKPLEYWDGAPPDVANFLSSIEYHRAYPSNAALSVRGDAGRDTRMRDDFDTIKMTAAMRSKFEYYTGKAKLNGLTLLQTIGQVARSGQLEGLTAHEKRTRILQIHSQFRKNAKTLLRYDPEFNIVEQQADRYAEGLTRAGASEQEISLMKRGKEMEAGMVRRMRRNEFL